MRQQRWFPIAALAVGLFAINLVTRLVIRFAFKHDDGVQSGASIVMFALIGLTLAVWTFRASQRSKPLDWLVPDWFLGTVGALVLTVLVGPFVSGDQPFADGAGNFFLQVWLYAGFVIAGTLVGYWVAVMLGIDYRSRSLKAYAERSAAKPRRAVRR